MNLFKTFPGWACWMVAAVGGLSGTLEAGAESLKLWADTFREDGLPMHGDTATMLYSHSPDMIQLIQAVDPKTIWYGWSPVALPAGTTMGKVVFYHGGGGGKTTSCMLVRVKMGQTSEVVGFASTNSATACQVTLPIPDEGKMTMPKGYRYFVRVFLSEGTTFRGVRIDY